VTRCARGAGRYHPTLYTMSIFRRYTQTIYIILILTMTLYTLYTC